MNLKETENEQAFLALVVFVLNCNKRHPYFDMKRKPQSMRTKELMTEHLLQRT